MPIAHNVIRFQGSLPGGEKWSITPRFASDVGPLYRTYEELVAWGESIRQLNDGAVFGSNIWNAMSRAVALDTIRLEYRDENDDLETVAEISTQGLSQSGAVANKPFQTSIVTSLITGRPGRSYRGRLYWPALGIELDSSSLRVPLNALTYLNQDVQGFLSAVQEAQPTVRAVRLAVVSNTLSVATAVTQIQMGDVLDTQRRRRDSLKENRVTTTIAPVE